MNNKMPTYRYDGKLITLTQDAYIDSINRMGLPNQTVYTAHAVDQDGNNYRVVWYPFKNWNGENEDESCDWDRPAYIEMS